MSDPSCDRCHENPGTVTWGDSAIMVARGYYAMWCERCATEVQLRHAIERSAEIPKLEAELVRLGGPMP